ncbi:MAG: cation:proton antiporter [Candidatus Dormibacteria bacterium]
MFAQLTILVLAGLAGPLLAFGRRALIPVVIGELLAGVVLGHTGFGVVNSVAQPFPAFSAIGFAMLMFGAGTHVDIGSPAIRQGFLRGLLALGVVAVTAVPIGLLLDHALGVGHPELIAVLITGSSAAIAFPILEERRLAGPNVAFLIAWVALADSLTVVIMPLTLAKAGNPLEAIGGDVAIIAAGVLVLVAAQRARRYAFVEQMHAESLRRGWSWQVRISLVLLFGLSAIAQQTGASTLVAGFIAGMILVRLRESDRLALQFSGVANGFFVPLFFLLLGAELNLRALVTSASSMVLAIGLAVGTVITHVIAARVAGHERHVATGLAASAQLGMPAAAASLGLSTGLLGPAEAAALVAAGCLTLVPATVGSLLLARSAPPSSAPQPESTPPSAT